MMPVKVLLFSADPSLVNIIDPCLQEAGYQVIHQTSGLGALELIKYEKPSLIILDIDLPDFKSLAIVRALRCDSKNGRLPVIILGANMREEDVLLGLEVGADLCLLEMFHPQVFVARVRSLLRRLEATKAV